VDSWDTNNYAFINVDPDVLMRMQHPSSGEEIIFLLCDGSSMGEGELYQIENVDNLWFVAINNPLLQEKINRSIEDHTEELGLDLARRLPLSFCIQSALSDITQAMDERSKISG